MAVWLSKILFGRIVVVVVSATTIITTHPTAAAISPFADLS